MDWPGKDLSLLGQVLLAPRVAWSLVGRADDLDRRDPSDFGALSSMDLDEGLLEWVVLDRLDRGSVPSQQAEGKVGRSSCLREETRSLGPSSARSPPGNHLLAHGGAE